MAGGVPAIPFHRTQDTTMHPKAAEYAAKFENFRFRESLTADQCQQYIDEMEAHVPHDQLPLCYDWLVMRRGQLRVGRLMPA
jgi:hypothetical protein